MQQLLQKTGPRSQATSSSSCPPPLSMTGAWFQRASGVNTSGSMVVRKEEERKIQSVLHPKRKHNPLFPFHEPWSHISPGSEKYKLSICREPETVSNQSWQQQPYLVLKTFRVFFLMPLLLLVTRSYSLLGHCFLN